MALHQSDVGGIARIAAMRTPEEAAVAFAPLLLRRPVECVMAAYLDGEMGVIGIDVAAEGDRSVSTLPVAAMMRRALTCDAAAMIVAHNHPGGDPTPSAHDVAATRRLVVAAAALGIRLVDHIVVATGGVFSFRREGLL